MSATSNTLGRVARSTWVIINADNPISLPLLGQFDPQIQDSKGSPVWQTKPGIAGGLPWIKYIGETIGEMSFVFHAMGISILDPYPLLAWTRLNELAKVNTTLGRPPRVYFNHGLYFTEGFITKIPKAPMTYWGGDNFIRSRIIREIGPIRVTITKIPKEPTLLSIGTNFVTKTENTEFEDLSRTQYNDARFAQTLAIHNQGKIEGDTLELPRKESGNVSRVTPVAPYFDEGIEGVA